ncbi:SRPBCC family protein [Lewinella sp. 4G2]|uniref:SRPBCC family protein n=1 Tax=Lewinella sp. 4G2 TaxID=1803372 RepID=UPI0007B4D77A|nr:SRPBCC family protein [Lewinella sp. 4G2]OAV45186.1 hypothetical protein A3850_012085 [Lewinella sp. 4G2]
MKKHITTTNPISAPASEVWANLRTGEGVDKWLPPVTACRVEGNRRYCEAGEARLEETIEESNDEAMTFRYSIQKQDMMPVIDIEGTMRVEAVDANNCLLHWDVDFGVESEELFAQLEPNIKGMYAAAAAGLGELALA